MDEKRGLPYRDTPERQAELARKLNTLAGADRHGFMAAGVIMTTQERWAQEDAVIEEFGELMRFDWTISDASGHTEVIRQVSTQIEAEGRAINKWVAMKVKVKLPVTTTRHDETAKPVDARKGHQRGG